MGAGYVFSDDGGKTPISNTRLNRGFNRALKKIGISYAEKLKRNLSFHAWRHFLNTLYLLLMLVLARCKKLQGIRL